MSFNSDRAKEHESGDPRYAIPFWKTLLNDYVWDMKPGCKSQFIYGMGWQHFRVTKRELFWHRFWKWAIRAFWAVCFAFVALIVLSRF